MSFTKVLIVSSPTSEEDKTQASLLYIATVLNVAGIYYDILDLSGSIDYFDPPEEFFCPCDSEFWLSSRIFYDAHWLDQYLESEYKKYDAVIYSALFSPDLLLHGRHALIQKKQDPGTITVIGGAAANCLNNKQISVLSEVFDHICIGYDIEYLLHRALGADELASSKLQDKYIQTKGALMLSPDYKLWDIRPFITVYSGHGCNWGKCRFCNADYLSDQKYSLRSPEDIAKEFREISKANGKVKDVMLSSDSFTKDGIISLTSCLKKNGSKTPYNLMIRGEKWVSEEIGQLLQESGCTDVFIGAEALEDDVLKIVNKGIAAKNIINAVKALSKYVKVTIGMLLFIPKVTKIQLDSQLSNLEKMLPYVHGIEPEILSVVQYTDFAVNNQRYGIKLWAKERTINDSWCYGLSPDIPWTFYDPKEAEMWFEHYDQLKEELVDLVQPCYWDSIEAVRIRF